MENKLLVLLYIPIIEKEYSVFIPINKTIGSVKNDFIIAISDLFDYSFNSYMHLVDKDTNEVYADDLFIKYTHIKNGTKLLLI